jgi:hypothetical protein
VVGFASDITLVPNVRWRAGTATPLVFNSLRGLPVKYQLFHVEQLVLDGLLVASLDQ